MYCPNVLDYQKGLHIASIFIILAISGFGTLFPVLAKTNYIKINNYMLLVIKCFGIGIIISTAFIHMMTPANEFLTSPCLSPLFTHTYPAFAGLIALFSVLTIQLIQTIAVLHFSKHKDNCVVFDQKLKNKNDSTELGQKFLSSDNCCPADVTLSNDEHQGTVTTYILVFGMSIHSVLVGLALGVASGSEFRTLLIAIGFHQFFEGFTFSATALDAGFKSLTKPILLFLIYMFTTPCGIAIGIAVHGRFNSFDDVSLIVQGVLSAMAAGILIYDSLVNLITSNITNLWYFRCMVWSSPYGHYGIVGMKLNNQVHSCWGANIRRM